MCSLMVTDVETLDGLCVIPFDDSVRVGDMFSYESYHTLETEVSEVLSVSHRCAAVERMLLAMEPGDYSDYTPH